MSEGTKSAERKGRRRRREKNGKLRISMGGVTVLQRRRWSCGKGKNSEMEIRKWIAVGTESQKSVSNE